MDRRPALSRDDTLAHPIDEADPNTAPGKAGTSRSRSSSYPRGADVTLTSAGEHHEPMGCSPTPRAREEPRSPPPAFQQQRGQGKQAPEERRCGRRVLARAGLAPAGIISYRGFLAPTSCRRQWCWWVSQVRQQQPARGGHLGVLWQSTKRASATPGRD